MKRRDYYIIGGLILLIPAGRAISFLIETTILPHVFIEFLVLINIISAGILIYTINLNRKKWVGELQRFITLLSFGIMTIIFVFLSKTVLLYLNSDVGLPTQWGGKNSVAAISIGMLIVAYAFYEMSNAPWYPESVAEGRGE